MIAIHQPPRFQFAGDWELVHRLSGYIVSEASNLVSYERSADQLTTGSYPELFDPGYRFFDTTGND